jgi:glycosyltransferase involved in cell wall biosynthesis
VERVNPVETAEARRRLEIPVEGRMAGCIGVLIAKKGVEFLLAGFERAELGSEDRLLLAGPTDDRTSELISSKYGELLRTDRLVWINRHLSTHELMLAVMACDVVCAPTPNHMGSSSFVIRSASAGRPVIASNYGWMGWAIGTFGLGWAADMLNSQNLAGTLRIALANAASWRLSPSAARFVRFHSAENFRAHWSARLRERLGIGQDEHFFPWESVLTDQNDAAVLPYEADTKQDTSAVRR